MCKNCSENCNGGDKMEIDKELVKKLRAEGKEERYIAWMLGVEEKDLPDTTTKKPEKPEKKEPEEEEGYPTQAQMKRSEPK
jgi:hypothetical protein